MHSHNALILLPVLPDMSADTRQITAILQKKELLLERVVVSAQGETVGFGMNFSGKSVMT